jgi:glutaredoxin
MQSSMPDLKTDLKKAREATPQPPPKSFFARYKNLIYVFLGGVGTFFAMSLYLDNRVSSASGDVSKINYNSPNLPGRVTPTVSLRREKNPGNVRLTLYQYVTCPFCCKVRAYLDYYGYTYDIVEVNSISKKQIDWSGYKKVPILAVQFPAAGTNATNSDPDSIKYDENIIVRHF